MGFLDNSGDIILDAVLTDAGRHRLARGTFNIAKYAFGDDEIDYSLFRNANHPDGAHASGSAYYDLNILLTPVLEAFTNNFSSLKSRLISLPRTDHLYLPVLKLNQQYDGSTVMESSGLYYVAVDETTENALAVDAAEGVINGFTKTGGNYIRVEQGLDTNELSPSTPLPAVMKEEQYGIHIDNRLGVITQKQNANQAQVRYVDDDNQAFYALFKNVNPEYVKDLPPPSTTSTQDHIYAIAGPRGTVLEFGVGAALDLTLSDYLFTRLGGTTGNYSYIDSNIRVEGLTTGFFIDIPVRFMKSN